MKHIDILKLCRCLTFSSFVVPWRRSSGSRSFLRCLTFVNASRESVRKIAFWHGSHMDHTTHITHQHHPAASDSIWQHLTRLWETDADWCRLMQFISNSRRLWGRTLRKRPELKPRNRKASSTPAERSEKSHGIWLTMILSGLLVCYFNSDIDDIRYQTINQYEVNWSVVWATTISSE